MKIYEKNARHIFRAAPGHLPDTRRGRALLVETASNEANLVGEDRFGNLRYARTIDGVGQVWVLVRGGEIRNGGVNPSPRTDLELGGQGGKVER